MYLANASRKIELLVHYRDVRSVYFQKHKVLCRLERYLWVMKLKYAQEMVDRGRAGKVEMMERKQTCVLYRQSCVYK